MDSGWDISRLLDTKLVDAIKEVLERQEPDLEQKIPAADPSDLQALITALVTILKDIERPPDLRAAAARMLGETAKLSRHYCGGGVAAEVSESLSPLITALRDPIATRQGPAVQLSIINAFQSFAPDASAVVVPALLNEAIVISSAGVLIAVLQVLRHFRVETVAANHDALVKLLQHDDATVRCEAYITIGWLGGLASPCLPELAERLRKEQDNSVLHELVRALALIDVDGDFLVHHVRFTAASQAQNLRRGNPKSGEIPKQSSQTASRETDQDKLLRLLQEIENAGVSLWRKLKIAWNSPVPPAGYRRMDVNEIISYIFPDGNAVDPKTIKNWIAARKLTAIDQPGNLYDVRVADLERLRAANSSPPSPGPPPASPPVR